MKEENSADKIVNFRQIESTNISQRTKKNQ